MPSIFIDSDAKQHMYKTFKPQMFRLSFRTLGIFIPRNQPPQLTQEKNLPCLFYCCLTRNCRDAACAVIPWLWRTTHDHQHYSLCFIAKSHQIIAAHWQYVQQSYMWVYMVFLMIRIACVYMHLHIYTHTYQKHQKLPEMPKQHNRYDIK